MTRRDKWTVLRFALSCGVVGPAVGALFLAIVRASVEVWVGPISVVEYPWWVRGKVAETIYNVGTLWIALSIFGTVLFGPGAAVLGGVGTWILLRKRERGASADGLRSAGFRLGAFLGAICPGLFVLPVSFLQRVCPNPVLWIQELFDPSNLPSIVTFGLTGMLTGLILGWTTANRLARRTGNGNH